MKFGGSGPIRSVFICLSIRLLLFVTHFIFRSKFVPKVSSLHNFQFYPKTTKIRPLFHPASNNQSLPRGFSKGLGQGWWKTQPQLNPLRTRGFKRLARNWTQRFSLIRNYSRLYWFATSWGARRARHNKYGYSSTAFLRRPLWSWTYPAAGPWRVSHESEVDKLRKRSLI